MRFGIQDLLLVTTLVAAYVVGFLYLRSLDSAAFASIDWRVIVVMSAAIFAPLLGFAWASRQWSGALVVAWRPPWWWVPHACVLVNFLGYVAVCAWLGRVIAGVLPIVLATQQVAFLWNTGFAVCEQGVRLGVMLVRWDECSLRVTDSNPPTVEYSHDGRLLPPRIALKSKRLPVPRSQFAPLRDFLASREANADSACNTQPSTPAKPLIEPTQRK